MHPGDPGTGTIRDSLRRKESNLHLYAVTVRCPAVGRRRKGGALIRAPTRIRTSGPRIRRPVLSPLSYEGVVSPGGFEPPTSALSGRRSDLLSYGDMRGAPGYRTPPTLLARQRCAPAPTPGRSCGRTWVVLDRRAIRCGIEKIQAPPAFRGHCTGGRNRTRNKRFWRPLLYQLSYTRPTILGTKKPPSQRGRRRGRRTSSASGAPVSLLVTHNPGRLDGMPGGSRDDGHGRHAARRIARRIAVRSVGRVRHHLGSSSRAVRCCWKKQ
jgi:hypothetical protein